MSEEMKKMEIGELEEVAGGKKHHKHKSEKKSIADCAPGTIEVKNEQYDNFHEKKKKCKKCGSKDVIDRRYFMVDTGIETDGQECNACHYRWLTV